MMFFFYFFTGQNSLNNFYINHHRMDEKADCLKRAEQIFNDYVDEIDKQKISDIAIRRALKKYDVKNLKIHNVTPLRARKIYSTLLSKYESGATSDKNWLENERRLFVWCGICYLYKNNLEVQELKNQDFDFLKSIFPIRDMELIKFQINSLVKKDNKNCGWEKEEDQVLLQIIRSKGEKQLEWSAISKQFFAATEERLFRNAKQCRERWLNHLDPNKSKGKWMVSQDIALLKEVLEKGKKWSQIVKALENKKNQHMVKNRFKSLVHKKEKTLNQKKIQEKQVIKLLLKDLSEIKESQQQNQKDQIDDQNFDDDEQFVKNGGQNQSENYKDEEINKKKTKNITKKQKMKEKSNQKQVIMMKNSDGCENKGKIIKQKRIQNMIISADESSQLKDRKEIIMPISSRMRIRDDLSYSRQRTPIEQLSANSAFKNYEEQNDFVGERRNDDEEDNEQKNPVNIVGNGDDVEMYGRLFSNVNLIDNQRYGQMGQGSQSPASFIMSPFPSVWTPALFLMENAPAESPRVGFSDFPVKFDDFVKDQQGNDEEDYQEDR